MCTRFNYDYRKCVECPYFKKEQEKVLATCESAWDAASDMRDYADKCWAEHENPCMQRNESKFAYEDEISKLEAILEEATEDEDSVCYVTSEDAPALKAAIKALKKSNKKYVLSGTDGFQIDTSVYDTLEEAQAQMRLAYNECSPDGLDEDSGESFCGELNAVLFGDQTVYCWDITEVTL